MLGAWDWLAAEKGFEPRRNGLIGGSMGAVTSLIAFALEPRVPAAFADSPLFTIEELLGDNLVLKGYPRWLAPGALWMGRRIWGDEAYAHSPGDALTMRRCRRPRP